MVVLAELTSENGAGYSLRRTSARLKQHTGSDTTKSTNQSTTTTTTTTPEKRKRAASGSKKVGRVVDKASKVESIQRNEMAVVVAPKPDAGDRNAYLRVTETVRAFNKLYLHFVQVEEKRCARAEEDEEAASKSKEKKAALESEKKLSRRPDLKAATEMKNTNAVLYPEQIIGDVPGVDVGHQFYSRAEMVAVGFHKHWLNGINYIGESAKKSMEKQGLNYKLPLTVSIVMSGQYEDDLDNCEDITYTGQGGNNLLGDKRQRGDQALRAGNLGLENCKDQSVPVRVIRGRECKNSYVGKVYTYDGLYKVVDSWTEKGISGFTVYKFRLKRLEGQPPLTTDEQIQFSRGGIPKSLSELRGLVCKDITGGLEKIPIPVTNLVDDPPIMPPGFTYIKDLKFSKNINVPTIAPRGCNCVGGSCVDSRSCACAKLNGGDLPYVQRDGGRLVEPKSVVFECGPTCGCGPDCVNKTSQRGPRFRLEVYRTPKKGWGVRSWDFIPSGAPICEYIGLVRRTDSLDPAADNTYVFDIDCLQTMKGLDGRESRLGDVSLPSHLQQVGEEVSDAVPYCIDAAQTGNVARFINHSCQPNLFVQCMLSKHHEMTLARVVLVAADNIPPLKELTYDYGYALDSVMGPDGNIIRMACYCGAQACRKRLY